MKSELKLSNGLIYEFDDQAVFEKDGKKYTFISLKKISAFKEIKKYQNLTVKPADWPKVRDWLNELIGEPMLDPAQEESVPF